MNRFTMKKTVWSSLRTVMLLTGAFAAGSLVSSVEDQAGAEVRTSPPRKAFLSGGARSELVLREISATLKRIETQLGRIERKIPKAGQPGSTKSSG
jgi:hypothetical protein